jgi:hypothetical protein
VFFIPWSHIKKIFRECHKLSSNRNRDSNNLGEFVVIELVHIVAHPLTIRKEVSILLTIRQILSKVLSKTGFVDITTVTIVQWTSGRQNFTVPT